MIRANNFFFIVHSLSCGHCVSDGLAVLSTGIKHDILFALFTLIFFQLISAGRMADNCKEIKSNFLLLCKSNSTGNHAIRVQ